ncbi:hypothetical protein BH10BDE1_BH10BDE1_02880 [soil metagenome]
MATSNNTFFDVLIDRLIEDVRIEFEADNAKPVVDEYAESKKVVVGLNDMVSQMIGFRARLAAPAANMARSYSQATARFSADDVGAELKTHERSMARPIFASSSAEIAFTQVTKFGARFYSDDLMSEGVTREALKRERRRVLLTLHPDRAPESDRVRAHEKFLAAAEAFSQLAEFSNIASRAA